jgi:hypothetical protein
MNGVYIGLICTLSPFQGPATSSIILKFDLIYIPTLGNGWCVCYCVTLIPIHFAGCCNVSCKFHVHPTSYRPHSSTLMKNKAGSLLFAS